MWNQNTPQQPNSHEDYDNRVNQPPALGQDYSSGPRCKQNHPLTITSTLPQNYPNGNYKCDICKVGRYCSPQYKVWHCNFCMFDVCFDCAKSYNNQSPQMQYPQQQSQDPNAIQYPSLNPFPQQQANQQQYPNQPQQPKKSPPVGQVTPVAHPKCPSGHNLILTSHLPPTYSQNTFGCDKCKVMQVASQQNQAWHCEMCAYDLCRKCSIRNPGYGQQPGQVPYGGMGMGGGMGGGYGNGMGVQGGYGNGMGVPGMDPLVANMLANFIRK